MHHTLTSCLTINSALPSSLPIPFFRSASSFSTRDFWDMSSFWYIFSSLVRRVTASVAIFRGEGAGILQVDCLQSVVGLV